MRIQPPTTPIASAPIVSLQPPTGSLLINVPLKDLTTAQVLSFARHHNLTSLLGPLKDIRVDGPMCENDVASLDDLADWKGAVIVHKKKFLRELVEARRSGVPWTILE